MNIGEINICCDTCEHSNITKCLKNIDDCMGEEGTGFLLWEPVKKRKGKITKKTNQFAQVLKERLRKIEEILGKKAEEYAKNNDRYHNFNVAARIGNTTPEKALLGMMMKHFVSVMDLIEDPESATFDLIDEKCGDLINYLILLEGMLKQRWSAYEHEEENPIGRTTDYICQFCKSYGFPSTFVLIEKTKERITEYDLCTKCANKLRTDSKYIENGFKIYCGK